MASALRFATPHFRTIPAVIEEVEPITPRRVETVGLVRWVGAAVVGGLLLASCAADPPGASRPSGAVATAPAVGPTPLTPPSSSPTQPVHPDASPRGTELPLRIERRTTDDATAAFRDEAVRILTDPRGWRRAGFMVTVDPEADFLLVLAEGDEVDELCPPYDTGGRFSCQNGPVVALNADRWRQVAPEWTGTLTDYRTYLVNHEVGHLLHLHHPQPQCPGPGFPAPVMLQQSTELGDCTSNPWPLPWEVDLAAARREPLAPSAEHEISDHRPSPPPQRQDLDHVAD